MRGAPMPFYRFIKYLNIYPMSICYTRGDIGFTNALARRLENDMRNVVLGCLFMSLAGSAIADSAVEMRHKGVAYAASGDYQSARNYLCESARMGYYTAQFECGYLLESSPEPIANPIEAWAWYSVVIAHHGTDTAFADERRRVISSKLTAAQQTEAELLASEFEN